MTNFVTWTPLTVFTAMVWLVTALVAVITLLVALWRPSYPGWRAWAVGHSSLVLGFLVSAARTEGSLQVSVLVGNGLLMAGAALYLNAFQRFCGEAPSRREVTLTAGAGLAVLLALWFLIAVRDDIGLRYLLVSAYVVTILIRLLALMLRQIQTEPALRSAYAANALVLLVATAFMLPRSRLMTAEDLAGSFALNLPNVLLNVGSVVLSVGGSFTFWLLHQDRQRHDMHQLHEELLALATHDPLTGLLNRRGLEEAYAGWGVRAQGPGTLLVLDIDHFKALNDAQGHAAGDRSLQRLAAALREVSAPGDIVGRLGGDEFMLLLTGPGDVVMGQLAQLRAWEQGATSGLGFSLSCGATPVVAQDTLAVALDQADLAMYTRKRSRDPLN